MDSLLLELKNADPIAFQEIDIQNPMRVLRALEIIRISGETLEKIRMKNKNAIAYHISVLVFHGTDRNYTIELINVLNR